MKITISGHATAIDAATKQEISAAEVLKKFDGVLNTEGSCCDYLPDRLEEIGLIGGQLRLAYFADKKSYVSSPITRHRTN